MQCLKQLLQCVLIAGLTSAFAYGNAAKPPALFYDLPESAEIELQSLAAIQQHRLVRINQLTLSDSTLPDHLRLNLFEDAVFDVKVLERGMTDKGIQIWRGTSESTGLARNEFSNVLILVNPVTGHLTGSLSVSGRHFFFEPLKNTSNYWLTEYSVIPEEPEVSLSLSTIPQQTPARFKREAHEEDGVYILDFFIGFSERKARQIPDLELVATQMIEHVNTALRNSRVDNVRLNLLGVGTTPHNPGVVPSVNGQLHQWFADEIHELGPDFVAMVQAFTGADNEAGGRAWLGGYYSDNGMYGTSPPVAVFRHEVGHNVGGGHCPGDQYLRGFPYAYGFDNGNYRTILCGNNLNMYSNPDIMDDQGFQLGDPRTANMARVWRERAAAMSAHRTRVIQPTYATIDTVEDELVNDGRCSLREAIANNTANSQVWSDCSNSHRSTISFSQTLNSAILELDSPLEITGTVEIYCDPGHMEIRGPMQQIAFSVREEGFLRVHDCTVSGVWGQSAAGSRRSEAKPADYAGFENFGFVGLINSTVRGFETAVINRLNSTIILNSIIENNKVGVRSSGYGITMRGSVVRKNGIGLSTEGSEESNLFVRNSTISGNRRGVVLRSGPGSHLLMHKVSVINNGDIRVNGGGVFIGRNTHGLLQETTVSGNTAQHGAGIYVEDGAERLLLVFVTMTDNDAERGGGIHATDPSVDIRINRTIVADQRSGGGCWLGPGVTARFSENNLLTDDSCKISGPTILFDDSAHLEKLADNGGPTLTHAPLSQSLAINGSTNCCCTSDDQRGFFRPDEICDIGAFQTQYFSSIESGMSGDYKDSNIDIDGSRSAGKGINPGGGQAQDDNSFTLLLALVVMAGTKIFQ